MKRITNNEYGINRDVKSVVMSRLRKEGNYNLWLRLRGALVGHGVPAAVAWKAATFPFPPQDGSPLEIVADPAYAEIARNWRNGAYPKPPEFEMHSNGVTINFDKFKDKPSEEFVEAAKKLKKAPEDWNQKWRDLSALVEVENADPVVEVQWVVANRWTAPEDIDSETVPSKAAVAKLSWVQESSANFGDFMRTFECKLLPDKKTVEYEARFKDDGRTLDLCEEFDRQFELEQQGASGEKIA
jgi:hypothetical protein